VGQLSLIVGETLSLIPASLIVEGEVQKVRIFKDFLVFFELAGDGQSISAMSSLADLQGEIPVENSKVRVVGEVQVGKKTEIRFKVRKLETAESVGEAAKKLEEIKLRLRNEGAFDDSRKKSLPKIPQKVAVVTAGTSSAWEDFKRASSVRFLPAKIVLFSVGVQGTLAEQEICSALEEILKKESEFDVVAVVRGGGSKSDLEVFNSEDIARAIIKFSIPVVSGVGHEDDVSLLDLVADVRASTPSNAAELIFPDFKSLFKEIEQLELKLSAAIENRISALSLELEAFEFRAKSGLVNLLTLAENRLELVLVKLSSLDFEKIFAKGFALLELSGKPIRSVKDAKKGDEIEATLSDGKLRLEVK
jgi:exodeoxyribonuclease VII large subunit